MRVLLDECLPRKLKYELPGHVVSTVPEMGWAGVKNGALIRLAAAGFDVFMTIDGKIESQQNLSGLDLAILVLIAFSNDIDVLRPLMPRVRETIGRLQPGEILNVGA